MNSTVLSEDLHKIHNDPDMNKICLDLQMSAAGTPYFILSKLGGKAEKKQCELIFGDKVRSKELGNYYLVNFVLNELVFHSLEKRNLITEKLDNNYFIDRILHQRKAFALGVMAVTMPNIQSLNPRAESSPILLTGLDSLLIFRHILFNKSALNNHQFEEFYPLAEFEEEIHIYIDNYSKYLKMKNIEGFDWAMEQTDVMVRNLLVSNEQYMTGKYSIS